LLQRYQSIRVDVADADFAQVVSRYDKSNTGSIIYEQLAGSIGLAADAVTTARAA
jgi:hypothetical protein